jgi:hypothetical protein
MQGLNQKIQDFHWEIKFFYPPVMAALANVANVAT